MRDDEERLLSRAPVSPDAKVRGQETLDRLRSERARLEQLLETST